MNARTLLISLSLLAALAVSQLALAEDTQTTAGAQDNALPAQSNGHGDAGASRGGPSDNARGPGRVPPGWQRQQDGGAAQDASATGG